MVDVERAKSPFKIYEEMYCDKCGDRDGCFGLMSFSTKFRMILDCSSLRNHISKTK